MVDLKVSTEKENETNSHYIRRKPIKKFAGDLSNTVKGEDEVQMRRTAMTKNYIY